MKILFICGSLEIGKDGVGDYTRKLAGELIRQGHKVIIFALHDRHLPDEQVVNTIQFDTETEIFTKRVSSAVSWSNKFIELKSAVQDFNPDWVSLQYVPYSFHKKGLPIRLANKISEIHYAGSWHIMFHELWIGISKISPLSHILTGKLQKVIVKKIIDKLKPGLITTTNVLYHSVLNNAGIDTVILPLFSNIPLSNPNPDFETDILELLKINISEVDSWLFIGTFGSIYPEADLNTVIRNHYETAKERSKKLAFISFGRINNYGKNKLEELKIAFKNKVEFLYLGEQPEKNVSTLLQFLNYGVSCTPTQHLGKSGVYASMKLHNLPVTLTSYEHLPEYDAVMKDYQQVLEDRDPYKWSVGYTASQFIDLLLHIRVK